MDNIKTLFKSELKVVNVGLEGFYKSVLDQGTSAAHVEWRPPAGGNEKLLEILGKLG
mgnify:CR=1 FL=1